MTPPIERLTLSRRKQQAAWREKNRKKLREYQRLYMRARRSAQIPTKATHQKLLIEMWRDAFKASAARCRKLRAELKFYTDQEKGRWAAFDAALSKLTHENHPQTKAKALPGKLPTVRHRG